MSFTQTWKTKHGRISQRRLNMVHRRGLGGGVNIVRDCLTFT